MEMDGLEAEINGETLGTCLSSYVDGGTVESHRYHLARRTTLEMLKDRGFVIPSAEFMSLDEFRHKYGPRPDPDQLRVLTSLRSDPDKKMMVVFCGPGKVKLPVIQGISTQIANKESLVGLILVLQNGITPQAQKHVEQFPFKVEIFQITDLLVNVTKHILKPKHQVLSEKEKEKLLKQYKLEENQLPRMSQKDAVAKYYGLKKGQVVKVSYGGEITQSHVTYRCVW